MDKIIIPTNIKELEETIMKAHATFEILSAAIRHEEIKVREWTISELEEIFNKLLNFPLTLKSYSCVTSSSENNSPFEKSHISGK